MRSLCPNLRRILSSCRHGETTKRSVADNLRFQPSVNLFRRPISSISPDYDVVDERLPLAKPNFTTNHLKNRIFKLKYPDDTVTTILQSWVENGHNVAVKKLRWIYNLLVQAKRYRHAYEIMKWMENQKGFQVSAADHAARVEVLIKMHGLKEAEEYFATIANTASQKAACLPLLHGYVQEKDTKKAEAFMAELNHLGLLVSPHPFNEMMKLYMATSWYEKVPLVIQQMKRNNIPRIVLSYNLWMDACGEISGFSSAEAVYREMVDDSNVEVGWSTLCTLAKYYIKAGLVDKAILALKKAETKLSTRNRLAYSFLITSYASLGNKEGILRNWEASKAVGGKITCADYMCILSCLVKLGDLDEAERILAEWESNRQNYDIRVSNVLLGAYMRNGLIDKAESFHLHTLKRGGCPNFKTWEILTEGWVKTQSMDKAIGAMKNGFSFMLKQCNWRPPDSILMAIADYFEKTGNITEADSFVRIIHHLGLGSVSLYKLLLRMRLSSQSPFADILNMIEKDGIKVNNEASDIVREFNCD